MKKIKNFLLKVLLENSWVQRFNLSSFFWIIRTNIVLRSNTFFFSLLLVSNSLNSERNDFPKFEKIGEISKDITLYHIEYPDSFLDIDISLFPLSDESMTFDSILFSNPYTILPSFIFLLCFLIFLIGLAGLVVVNNNLLIILMSIEIMFFGLGLFIIFFSLFVTNASGFVIALVMITTSAAETVIGLSLLVRYCVLLDNITVSKNIVNPYLSS